ncbi:hypothetical protein L6164_009498 [Bauhinia variegata]|uniref:Uncharacterized protein n=1 Tax=Bauhinia variegata TaxID=167791 RepID=A0ACB9PJV3_BAUVA|nr:hypothetical protein L6164_009498 [Bauhinia variegata]
MSSMDLPTTEVDLGPEKIEDKKELPFPCDLCDTEVVHKIAQMFMPGLATACVDNTSGDIFRTPGSVAADLRNEMIEYLTQRSESFVAESVILEGGPEAEVSDNPFDIISDFVDDFASTKRNLFSRVSGWLLNDKREDKIDDFIQDMERDGFWSLDKRETIAETLLKNVDFKCLFHCSLKSNTEEELASHVYNCNFRSMICENEGCESRFCAANLDKHDAICPFKIIPCEQKCSENIMRRAMDRHCITSCPMRLVNCPFYSVGCRVAIRQCDIVKHRSDELHSHLLYILRGIYKDASDEDLKRRVEQIVEAESNSRLEGARDVRPLKNIVKGIEAKLGPFEYTPPSPPKENIEEKNANNEDAEDSATKENSEEKNKNENAEDGATKENNEEKNAKNENAEDANADGAAKENSEEKNAKKEDAEDSDLEKKSTEQTANVENSEASSIMNKNTADNNNVDIEDKDSQIKNQSGEESTQHSNMENSSEKSAVSSTADSSTAENNVNSEARDSQMKNQSDEESAQNANMEKSSDKPEVSALKKDSEETSKEKDAEDSDLEIKSKEESKQTKPANSL